MPIITRQFNSIQPGIFTDVVVSAPGSNEKWSVKALWDTGANVSVITESVAKNLGLEIKGCTLLRFGNGSQKSNTYKIDLQISEDIVFKDIFVRECNDGGNFEMAIGMDVISKGNFQILNSTGKTFFKFEIAK